MTWQTELLLSLRVVYAALLGAIIGLEREQNGRDAGIRTYAAVTLGACAFAIISTTVVASTDPPGNSTRIAAQVVSGIGFLGAGVIMRSHGHISGLTTSATLWASAAVGLAVGFGEFVLATVTAGVVLLVLLLRHLPWVSHGEISREQAADKLKEKED